MSGRIELVVVGAHLSGFPLNHQLILAGGRLLRRVQTAPCYRFYALAGGPPARPGLLRVAAGTGARIDTEVWDLDPASFGGFVAAIASPLTIGTVFLSDGTSPKGFLAEPEGLVGAQDISHFSGWRAYMARQDKPGG
ncbi:MAG: hypothetical protein ACHQAQ_14950 [Hyphomicrobiales bacterium]